jgi:hypothetical protein
LGVDAASTVHQTRYITGEPKNETNNKIRLERSVLTKLLEFGLHKTDGSPEKQERKSNEPESHLQFAYCLVGTPGAVEKK